MSSLPVPLSASISTLLSFVARSRTVCSTRRMDADCATTRSSAERRPSSPSSSRLRTRSCRRSSARAQGLEHPVRVGERLLEIVERPGPHARHRRVDAGVARHDDDLGVRPALAELAQELEPRSDSQPQVEQHHLGLVRELRADQRDVARFQHRVAPALELAAQAAHERRLVIGDEHARGQTGADVAGRVGGHPRRDRSATPTA